LLLGSVDNGVEADLNGFGEVDPAGRFGAGDLNGDGLAKIRLRPEDGQACFKLERADIDEPIASHIHSGGVGVNGPIFVNLLANSDHFRHENGDESADGCTEGVAPELLDDIANHPGAYYVNIHTARFPGGAIRGNLEREEAGI
jgi:hypothetical protein